MDWTAIRESVGDVSGRVATLLRDTTGFDRPALGSWSVGDLASHLVHVWEFDALQATGAPEPIDDLHRLSDLTGRLVEGESDRDPARLAERVEAASRSFLDTTAAVDPSDLRAWFGGVAMPVDGLACHAISESLLHGHDLAQATGRPWPLPARDASFAIEGFVVRVLADPASHGFVVDWDAAGDLHAVFEVRLRTGPRAFFVFDGRGKFRLDQERPPGRAVDCHILADPAALLMVVWKRRSQWSAIARGQLLAWGRRPWLGLRLVRIFRTP